MSRDTDRIANINRIELPGEIGRIEEQQDDNILFEKERERIGNDLWRQLKRVSISIACIDQAPVE